MRTTSLLTVLGLAAGLSTLMSACTDSVKDVPSPTASAPGTQDANSARIVNVPDPRGDASGTGRGTNYDLLSTTVQRTASSLNITLTFAQPVLLPAPGDTVVTPSQLRGIISLDTDQNSATGTGPFGCEANPANINPDVYLDLGVISSRNADGTFPVVSFIVGEPVTQPDGSTIQPLLGTEEVARATVRLRNNRLQLRIPLAQLKDDGLVNLAVLVGNGAEFITDCATSNQGGPISSQRGAAGKVVHSLGEAEVRQLRQLRRR
ncbi:hypothetical protein [Hymenobacter terrenus]|uniref:hypothetical protein n=1 Tax=Hymenobacter terrenus TaxID=1629124 RepID=UPI0006194A69|nr:hypothetical protein [Hymenobacter terrenus]